MGKPYAHFKDATNSTVTVKMSNDAMQRSVWIKCEPGEGCGDFPPTIQVNTAQAKKLVAGLQKFIAEACRKSTTMETRSEFWVLRTDSGYVGSHRESGYEVLDFNLKGWECATKFSSFNHAHDTHDSEGHFYDRAMIAVKIVRTDKVDEEIQIPVRKNGFEYESEDLPDEDASEYQ